MAKFVLLILLFICSFSLFANDTAATEVDNVSVVFLFVDGVGWVCVVSDDEGMDDKDKLPVI